VSYIADAYLKAIAKIATPLEEKVARLEAELAQANAKCANCNWIKRYEDLECFKDTWTVQA